MNTQLNEYIHPFAIQNKSKKPNRLCVPYERHAFVLGPNFQFINGIKFSGVCFVVVMRQIDIRSENDDRNAWRMHLRDNVAETNMKFTIIFQIGGHTTEYIVFDHITTIKVANDDPFARVQLFQVSQMGKLNDRILQLIAHEFNESVLRPLATIFTLLHLTVLNYLQRWIFCNLETFCNRFLFITVDFAHNHLSGAELCMYLKQQKQNQKTHKSLQNSWFHDNNNNSSTRTHIFLLISFNDYMAFQTQNFDMCTGGQ